MTLPELTDQEITELDLESLAYVVLQHLIATDEWVANNFFVGAQVRGRSDEAQRCLIEGLGWLHANGLIATGKPGQSAPDALIITRRGAVAAHEGLARVRAGSRLAIELHPLLIGARAKFLGGAFEFAVFQAMREVEIRTRAVAQMDDSMIGVPLMQEAWKTKGGPLTDPVADPGEQVAVMQLFAGAVGTFKNPPSHRQIDYQDATEASDAILLADLLLRLLDKTEARLSADQRGQVPAPPIGGS